MNDFSLKSQNCDMQFKLDIEDKLVAIEVVNWTITQFGTRDSDLSGYIDLSVHEVKFLRDSLTAFINKIEGKNEKRI